MKGKIKSFVLLPVAIRNIIPFAMFILIFSGISELFSFLHYVTIIWILLIIINLSIWSIINLRNENKHFFDQLALSQFYIIVSNLFFSLIANQLIVTAFYFFTISLIILSFNKKIIQLVTLEFAAVLLYQTIYFQPGQGLQNFLEFLPNILVITFIGLTLSSFKSDKEIVLVTEEETIETTKTDTIINISNHKEEPEYSDEVKQRFSRFEIKKQSMEETVEHINQILEMINDILSPYSTLYFELKRDAGILRPLLAMGPQELFKKDCAIPLGKGPIGWAAKNGLTFSWKKTAKDNALGYYKQNNSVQSLIAVPVTDGHLLSGVLIIDSQNKNAFSSKDQKVLEIFARQISLLFEIQELAYSKQIEAEEQKILNESGNNLIKSLKLNDLLSEITRQLHELIECDKCIIFLHEQSTEKLFVANLSPSLDQSMLGFSFDYQEGLTGWVFKNHTQPVTFSDARKVLSQQLLMGYGEPELNVYSMLFIPLHSISTNVGVILLTSEAQNSFQSLSGDMLSILANQYSLALTNSQMYQKIEKLAITDGLTLLINHRYFQELLTKEFRRYEREPSPLSLIMLDIDHFKQFNDRYGHPVGDSVLRRVAQILKNSCREIDIVARYGGEEFTVLLINTDREGAMLMAERIRQRIAQDSLQEGELTLKITVSLGVATFPNDCNNKQELIDKADKSLYKAKDSGRNKAIQTTPLPLT